MCIAPAIIFAPTNDTNRFPMILRFGLVACAALCIAQPATAQTPVDSALLSRIMTIRAVDSHAHPMRPVPPGAPADSEYDALPLDGIPAFPVPWRLTLEAPVWAAAQTALFHVSAAAGDTVARRRLRAAVTQIRRQHAARFPEWALDQAGIEMMMANRIAMGPGLAPPRFRWIPFADALMLPLDTRGEASRTPDTRSLYPREAALLRRYLRELGLNGVPATLDDYVRNVVRPTLQRQRNGGAVAIKFEAAYLRPLDFDDPDASAAQRIYAKYARGGVPARPEYKTVEDYLFRVITREAGRLGMAVQIHALETFGGFYAAAGSAVHLLEPAFNDSTLRGTKFVIVHGGWPIIAQTSGLLGKPNVYADISMMSVMLAPAQLAGALRQWLGEWPDKVLFGTDAFDGGAEQGWEQVAWVGSTTSRRALAMALTGMMRDGDITRTRAEELARMVMRENAIGVYGLAKR
jgi:predicted TIM-barrel fold metal-dependent hydrolase